MARMHSHGDRGNENKQVMIGPGSLNGDYPNLNLRSLCLALCLFAASLPSGAVELWSDDEGERVLSLDTALKWSAVASRAPYDPILFPKRWSGLGLTRVRLGFNYKIGESINAQIAYEQRARLVSKSGGAAAGGGTLPSFAKAPYRLAQLDWSIAGNAGTFSYRHEIDRAYVAFRPPWGEITIGRQAIGLGRGLMFSAVDLFTPFSTVEVDREWRRGVDALRVEYRLSDTTSMEILGAFGESWDDSALIGRIRGYMGNVDGELIVGKRGEDLMIAGTMSAIVGNAEIHTELALFHTPEDQPSSGPIGGHDLVLKAVLGASYTFDIGRGLTLFAEYHYSGFGVNDVTEATLRFLDPDFQERFLRGDSQILGQHALALTLAYPINDELSAGLLLLESPTDGSGLASLSLNWSISQRASLSLSGFVPWGAKTRQGLPQSEYGASPITLFAQLNLYF